MNKTILILANNLAGLFSFRIELMRQLVDDQYRIVVSAPKYQDYCERLKSMGISFIPTVIDRRGINPFKDLALILRYLNIVKSVRPDVILTYTIKPNIYGGIAAALCQVPQIVNITGLGSAVENPGLLQKISLTLYNIGFRKTKTIFFQNTANKAFFERLRIDKAKHRLIPGSGVNISHHILQPYPQDDSVLNFIFISRVMKEKGIEEVLKAADYLKSKNIPALFHVLGACEEDYVGKIKAYESLGLIKYHGQQSDVRPFIKMAHCLIHPSYYPEGMSNVVLEACAAGRPVLTTNRPGCKEPIEDNITGLLFEERDTKGMLRQIDKFVAMTNKDREEMGKRARAKVEREFDRNIVVDAYIEELKLILDK